ncbi:MAG: recombinase family protein [Proteobacteria bacterium]|nr:recombinase family protein [Pseudomonadota bacterium]
MLYHRVSSRDQDPQLARHELRTAARARSMKVASLIEETGSGARNDRPGLRRVMDAARDGQINAVIVWKLDRFGRSALDLLANIEELQRCGIRFIATSQGIDVHPNGDAMSRLIITVLAAVAAFERELIAERTVLGLAKARRLGHRIGRPRSRRTPDRDRVLALRADGVSWREVGRRLRCPVTAAWRAARSKNGPRKPSGRSRRRTT